MPPSEEPAPGPNLAHGGSWHKDIPAAGAPNATQVAAPNYGRRDLMILNAGLGDALIGFGTDPNQGILVKAGAYLPQFGLRCPPDEIRAIAVSVATTLHVVEVTE